MDTEFARLVGCRGNDAVPGRVSPDDDGLAPPSRMIKLFNGGEKGIKIHEQDGTPRPWRETAIGFRGRMALRRRRALLAHAAPIRRLTVAICFRLAHEPSLAWKPGAYFCASIMISGNEKLIEGRNRGI